jgi:hypothetical protein
MLFDTYIIKQSPSDLNYGQLNITRESRYSSLMPWHINQVKQAILYETQNLQINTIVDCNAHIGVDTILFRLLFKEANITSIELNKQTYDVLEQNVNNLQNIVGDHVKNINVVHDDCLNYIFTNQYDLVYIDPPWSNSCYKQEKKINLYLSKLHLGDIINNILRINKCLVIVKLPFNIDFPTLWNKITFNINNLSYNIHQILTPSGKISYLLMFIHKNL